MPRINIEDVLWKDPRWMTLCIKLGDQYKALGVLVMAWVIAQKYWCPNKLEIPNNVWKSSQLGEEIIESGLAERRAGGIYMRGSEENFEWWFECREAGKRGGKGRVTKAKGTLTNPKGTLTSSSYSSSFSNTNTNTNTLVQQVERVYGLYPRKQGKTQGTKRLAREIKTDQDLSDLEKAVRNYAAHIQDTDHKFIKVFSTFASEWRDWINPPEAVHSMDNWVPPEDRK